MSKNSLGTEKRIFVQGLLTGSLNELAKNDHITKIRIFNISYENIEVVESEMNSSLKRNNYFIAALIELTMDDDVIHNIVAEDVLVVQNHEKIIVTFYDNYTYMTNDIIFEEYQKVVASFNKDENEATFQDKKLTSLYLKSYREEVSKGYKDLFNFYKLKNREFNQNTLENSRYMKIRKKLSRNILKEMLISRIIIEYRTKNILT